MSELPIGWAYCSISEICLVNPKHSPKEERSQIVSFVPMSAVSEVSGAICAPEERKLEEIWKGYTHFQNRDVIFAKITPCMENGKIAIAENLINGLACGSTEFHVLRPELGVSGKLIWYFLRQASFREEAEPHMTGAVGQRRVPKDYLASHQYPLAPSTEQARIVEKLDLLFLHLQRAREELQKVQALNTNRSEQTKLLNNLEKAILNKAFQGNLVAQNPEDESASALLERIRQEREAQAPKRRAPRKKRAVGHA